MRPEASSAFPSRDENAAATALLLLALKPVPSAAVPPLPSAASFTLCCFDKISSTADAVVEEIPISMSSCISDSSSSRRRIRDRSLQMLSLAAFLHGYSPEDQAVKKARSQHGFEEFMKVEEEERSEETVASTLTSASSSAAARSDQVWARKKVRCVRKEATLTTERKCQPVSHVTPSIRRRAAAIMDFLLSDGSSTEAEIRVAVGDSPDTSKALRMLVRLDEVRRAGGGGVKDPFIYTAVESDSEISFGF